MTINTGGKSRLQWWVFWAEPAVGWFLISVFVYLFPQWLRNVAGVLLVVVLFYKTFSIARASIWIWKHGREVLEGLVRAETGKLTEFDRICSIYDLQKTKGDESSLLNHFDWEWKHLVAQKESGTWKDRSLAHLLMLMRNTLYRFEALMVLSVLALVSRSFPTAEPFFKYITGFLMFGVLSCVTAMAIEVLFGNVIMGPGYDRYCHRHLENELDTKKRDGRDVLLSAWNCARLSGFSLLAIAAALHALHVLYEFRGFKGILTYFKPEFMQGGSEAQIRGYLEFVAFTLTTFATVGYGDVHPNTIVNRLVVAYVHVLSMGMVVVLLQLVLSKREWPSECVDANKAQDRSPPSTTVSVPQLLSGENDKTEGEP